LSKYERETERWLKDNTALNQLFELSEDQVSRHDLCKAAEFLYDKKDSIENELYTSIKNTFSLQSKIVIYDLTNTSAMLSNRLFFEGRKKGSSLCKFGNSKEKRYDCRLICVALLVDIHGFITYTHFYTSTMLSNHSGNQGEPATLADAVADIKKRTQITAQYPVIVMDAGIATEDNLKDLRSKKHDYVCVSRSKPSNYEIIETQPVVVEDNRKNKIELQKIKVDDKDDNFVYVNSEQKAKKAMH